MAASDYLLLAGLPRCTRHVTIKQVSEDIFDFFIRKLSHKGISIKAKASLKIDSAHIDPQINPPNTKSRFLVVLTSSTAQGGGGNLRNRKPIGEVGCCESWLLFLEWLQLSPHPQLQDVAWRSGM